MSMLLTVSSLLLLAADTSGQSERRDVGHDPFALAPDVPEWDGVRINSFCASPDPRGAAKGEFVELYNMNSPDGLGAVDLSGWSLALDSGETYTFPNGTAIPAERYLVVDFSGGSGSYGILPDYQTQLLSTGYSNSFFENPFSDGHADGMALVRPDGSVKDFVAWTTSPDNIPDGPVTRLALRERQWHFGEYVEAWGTLEVGASRKYPTVADLDTSWATFGGNLWERGTGKAVGTDHRWFDPITGQRLFEENVVEGMVINVDRTGSSWVTTPIRGASVKILEPVSRVVVARTATDQDGLFRLDGIRPGRYDLCAEHPDYVAGWRILKDKNPHRPALVSFSLQAINSKTSATGVFGPAGGLLEDPAGRFSVRFPPGFLAKPTTVSATWIEPGTQSLVLDCLTVATNSQGLRYVYEHLGGVSVSPHIPAPADPSLKAQVILPYQNPSFNCVDGEPLLVESIDDAGNVERFPDGHLTMDLARNWQAVAPAPHFSEVSAFKRLLLDNGKAILVKEGPATTDRDGDGVASYIFDSYAEGVVHPCCPGDKFIDKLTLTVGVSETADSHWKDNGEFEWETKGSVLAALVGSGKVRLGGETGESTSSTNATSRTFVDTVVFVYTLNPPPSGEKWDRQAKSCLVLWRFYNVYTSPLPSVLLIPSSPLEVGREPDIVLAVPVGTALESEISGHCN